jgi:selenocysteine-specific elongation factor
MTTARHVIFGTAGHVDHGKSSLVLALTGTDPDRLAEEKAREMTIDLGFAFLDLPGLPDPVAIVDVPGHEMFLRNMVAGATGVDAAIFVVAADEAVMPQTVEHMDVLLSLGIRDGVIALTKCDKAGADLQELAIQDIKGLVAGTFLEKAEVIRTSSVTGAGLDELREELAGIATRVAARKTEGTFRLPIDRVFTLKGIGTVVTGTVISGSVRAGETVDCLPRGRTLRLRSLQVHNSTVDEVQAGQRAALNLADASKDELARGDVLVAQGRLTPSLMMDVRLNVSLRAPRPITQRARVRVHHGTSEVMARTVLLEGETLNPGESGLVQLRLESPLVPVPGDRFVVRTYSPMMVIGGGTVVDAHPPKRQRASGAADLAKREHSDPLESLIETLDRAGPRGKPIQELQSQTGMAESALTDALNTLKERGETVAGRRGFWFSAGAIHEMEASVIGALSELHKRESLKTYVSLNAVSARCAPKGDVKECFRLTVESLEADGKIRLSGEKLRLESHQPNWGGRPAAARQSILAELKRGGIASPGKADLAKHCGLMEADVSQVLDALIDADEIVILVPDIYMHPDVMSQAREKVRQFIQQNGSLSISQARDLLGASRKYLLPLLETMDRAGVTVRQGDVRILRQR